MRNKSLKYIFGLLLSSVLLTVGCGSSSSNNPVSTGSVNSGLVSVSGNVKNSDGNGTVAFYTPAAISESNMANSSVRTVVNNQVYTFNIDENGNYAGQVPAGDYYIIAQNSDGSLKYASGRQSVKSDAVAEGTSNDLTYDITLVPTISISGELLSNTPMPPDSELPWVYLENMPYAVETTSVDGKSTYSFTLSLVPLMASYTLCSNIWSDENIRYRYSYTTTSSQIETAKTTKEINDITISSYEPISLSGNNIKGMLSSDKLTSLDDVTVIAVTQNKAYTTQTKSNGNFVLPIDASKEPILGWGLNLDEGFVRITTTVIPDDEGLYKIIYNAE